MVDGTLVASSATTSSGGLWTGTLANKINRTLAGGSINGGTWTNTRGNGTSAGGSWDYYNNTVIGQTTTAASGWVYASINTVGANNNYVYLVSPSLTATAVPEPSTSAMALAGLACGGWQLWQRRKRA